MRTAQNTYEAVFRYACPPCIFQAEAGAHLLLLRLLCPQLLAKLGSQEAVLRVAATAVCAAGSKSCSHVFVLLERYSPLLHQLMQAVGEQQGQEVLLEVLGHMYSQLPMRLQIALSRWVCLLAAVPSTAHHGIWLVG
jgi:hypothetical protein